MRKIWTRSVAMTATTGALVFGMAGMASASDHTETDVDQTETQTDTRAEDVADVTLNDILNGSLDVGDVASDNTVLNGVDADVTDLLNRILSGNDTDASTDSSEETDGEGGLLGLLN